MTGEDQHLARAVAVTRDLYAAAACSCCLVTEDGDALRFVAAEGVGADQILGVTIPVSRGIVGWSALTGQPLSVSDVTGDSRFARDIAEATGYVPTRILAAPLVGPDGEVLGVLEVLDPGHADAARFGELSGSAAELAVLTATATQVAVVLAVRGSDGGAAEQTLSRRVAEAVQAYLRERP